MNETILSTANETRGTSGVPLFAQITIVLQSVTAAVVITGNVLVLTAILVFKRLRDVTGIFVANLAVADLIIGFSLPFQIAFFYVPDLEQNKYTCLLRYEIILFASNASLFSLVCTVIDRYIAIAHPLNYFQIMSNNIAYIIVVVIWCIDLVIAFIPSMGANEWDSMPMPICLYELVISPYYKLAGCCIGLFFAMFILVLYGRIYFIARRHVRQIRTEAFQQSDGVTTVVSKQMHNVLVIVVLLFHIAWLPFYFIQLTMIFPENVTKEKVLVANFLAFLGVMNSTINPVIYAWKNKSYRYAFKRLLRRRMTEDTVTNISVIGN